MSIRKDVFLHHNYLHNCATEAFYVGYFNYEYVNSDGGRPHNIVNSKVYKNIIDSSGWDSIQVRD